MAIREENGQSFADSQADIRTELTDYSTQNGYTAEHFADAACSCGGNQFFLVLDEGAGAAIRGCPECQLQHAIGDSADYCDDADFEQCVCSCGRELLEITVGVALYADSEDVRWFYLGCRCPDCGLVGCYGDWKNEFNGFRKLLANI